MSDQLDFEILNKLVSEDFSKEAQNVFEILVSDLSEYLGINPFDPSVKIEFISVNNSKKLENVQILDRGVKRFYKDHSLVIQINEANKDFYPFIFLREAFYLFLPTLIKDNEMIKVFVNQIIENNLQKLNGFIKWHNHIRDRLVNRDFLVTQSDKLQKFFKIETSEEHETPVQFFFREINENALIIGNRNLSNFYSELFEKYTYKISRSLYNEDIINTLVILIKIFFKNKRYINLTDYQNIYNNLLVEKKIGSTLSLKKFHENLQWINKCTPIAPTYQINYNTIGISPLICDLTFNPLLERNKVKNLIEQFPFRNSTRIIENNFAGKFIAIILIPTIYLNDIISYFNKLETIGYLINKRVLLFKTVKNFLNLNYYTDISSSAKIIDPSLRKYVKDYECEHVAQFKTKDFPIPLSIFDYTILNRTKNVSVTGLTFDKRIETLNAIKEDVENEYRKQLTYIDEFTDNFHKLGQSSHIKEELLTFLNRNLHLGLLYIRELLSSILKLSNLIHKILIENPMIKNTQQLTLFLQEKRLSQILEENLIKQKVRVKKFVLNIIIPKYFQSIKLFDEERQKIDLFYHVIIACSNLKIYNLKQVITIIKNPDLVSKIRTEKEERLKQAFKQFKSYKITNQKIESVIDEFLSHDPPVIIPMLVNTIITSQFAKYYPEIFLRNTPKTQKKLDKLKSHFPRVFITRALNLDSQEIILHILPYSNNFKEKARFISSLYTLFKEDLMIVRRNFWRGIERVASVDAKDFYDFEKKEFFYSKDFFEQLYIYTKNKFENKKLENYNIEATSSSLNLFWSPNNNIKDLVEIVKKRSSSRTTKYNPNRMKSLLNFRSNLEQVLHNQDKFSSIKSTDFYSSCIKSIKFVPSFRKFGLAQYFLYLCPHDWGAIDLKLLLLNSFQNIQHPAQIDRDQPVFIKYLFPYRAPNKSYLNWLIKSKKIIRESCFFFIKKFFDITQFDTNLSSTGWYYSSNRFKIHIQNVLFNPNYSPQSFNIREFSIDKFSENELYGLATPEFEALSQIYAKEPLDLKTYLGTNKYNYINSITSLLEKQLIFPFINFKNLGFQDKILIILPNVKKELEEKIIKVLNFFNVCRIYEIEGDFYVYGLKDIQSFETGLMIELWFPQCELDEFFDVFDLLFEYLEINQYLILTDLVQGKNLIKEVYGNSKFLEQYNPLINLQWNNRDKIWMNHKVFNEKFEPIYPDLFYGSKREDAKFND
ncbi:MAG: hypothetical protein ACFFDB_08085 [Promethearchaeota archaeon]